MRRAEDTLRAAWDQELQESAMRTIRETGVGSVICALAWLCACSDGGSIPSTMTNFAGPHGDGGGAPAPDAAILSGTGNASPDGFAYPTPTGGYGHNARKGKTPGSIIQNFKFLGYPNADESKGLQTIALADYYDPCGKRLQAPSPERRRGRGASPATKRRSPSSPPRRSSTRSRSCVVQALSDGPTKNVPATTGDLQFWISENKSNFTEMLDPNLANLGIFFDAAAVPWNADIDPRTMEILDDGTGYAGTVDEGAAARALAYANQAPGYPVACPCRALAPPRVFALPGARARPRATAGPLRAPAPAGDVAPDFTARDVDGNTFRLADHLGKEVILLDFWSTFCEPCKAEFPHLRALYATHKSQGLARRRRRDGRPGVGRRRAGLREAIPHRVPGRPRRGLAHRRASTIRRSRCPSASSSDATSARPRVREGYNPGDERLVEADVTKALDEAGPAR